MRKSEIFNTVVAKICEVCEVRRDSLINHKKIQTAVDARILAVQYLRRLGLSTDEIALYVIREAKGDCEYFPEEQELKNRSRAINKMFNGYSARCLESYSFCQMSKEILEFCLDRFDDLYLSWQRN